MKTAILSLITALTPFTPVEHGLKRFLSIKQLFLRIALNFFKKRFLAVSLLSNELLFSKMY